MKITRTQLRKLINESIYGGNYYPPRVPNPADHVSPSVRKKLDRLIQHDDESFQRQGYDLATTLQRDMTVFPNDGDPYTRKPYEGDDYLADFSDEARRIQVKLKNAYDAVAAEEISTGLGGVHLGGLSRNEPDFKRKAQLLQDVQDAYQEAIDYSKKKSDSLHPKLGSEGWVTVFMDTFQPFIPKS
tara:strand:- start:149 stop:706 length:558 start_codon:yes stop_codon:yes gene_type:complete